MKRYSFLVLLLVFSVSCKKDQQPEQDQIIYTDFEPDVTVSYNYIQDTTCFTIDPDHDSVTDFSFSANRVEVILPSGSDWGYTFECTGHNGNQVTLPNQNPKKWDSLYLYDAGIAFDASFSRWRSETYFLFNIPTASYYRCLSDTSKYLGLMISKGGKQYYGWVMVDWDNYRVKLKVKSCAVRTKAGKPLRTGER